MLTHIRGGSELFAMMAQTTTCVGVGLNASGLARAIWDDPGPRFAWTTQAAIRGRARLTISDAPAAFSILFEPVEDAPLRGQSLWGAVSDLASGAAAGRTVTRALANAHVDCAAACPAFRRRRQNASASFRNSARALFKRGRRPTDELLRHRNGVIGFGHGQLCATAHSIIGDFLVKVGLRKECRKCWTIARCLFRQPGERAANPGMRLGDPARPARQ